MDRWFCIARLVCVFAGMACIGCASTPRGEEMDVTKCAKILLLGDSTLDCNKGEDRVEHAMMRWLKEKYPQGQFEVNNLARGGMWIGPADATGIQGIAQPLLKEDGNDWYSKVVMRCPDADVIFVKFSGNDSKVYPPEGFGKRFAALCDRLENDYPKARIILSTGTYVDPKIFPRYWRAPSMVKNFKQGNPRNEYVRPYYDQTQVLANRRDYGFANLKERMKAEVEAGTTGLYKSPTDAHPSPLCSKIIADVYLRTLFGMDDALTPVSKRKDTKKDM